MSAEVASGRVWLTLERTSGEGARRLFTGHRWRQHGCFLPPCTPSLSPLYLSLSLSGPCSFSYFGLLFTAQLQPLWVVTTSTHSLPWHPEVLSGHPNLPGSLGLQKPFRHPP